jgi:hypothetical protein
MTAIKAPFPYFGGKSRAAGFVWERFGDVPRYIEPFAGSLAVLLARPQPFGGREIVNDSDGLLVNVWRAMQRDPDAVAEWADYPATESDMHARHAWLVGHREALTASLEGDPDWFDAKAAGWWLWGIGLWIGGGWCSGKGPWKVTDGQLLHAGDDGKGIHRKLLHAGDDGKGIHRKLLRAGGLMSVFEPLAERLHDVMIMAGDWTRVVTPAVLFGASRSRAGNEGACAVFLDPPYADGRTPDLYAKDSLSVADAVREWAIANGDDVRLRIALCGYEGEMPGWSEVGWTTKGGYGGGRGGPAAKNQTRERIWFSPWCLKQGLWDAEPIHSAAQLGRLAHA